MQYLNKVVVAGWVALSLGMSSPIFAQQDTAPAQADAGQSMTAPAAGKTAGGMNDPAMMEKMKPYMTPGENHRRLDPLVGKFNAKVSMWMMPTSKPEISQGTAENRWVLNQHHLEQKFTGTFAGQPFEGLGYTGYDNFREEYQSVWMDSMGTGIMYMAGKYDPAKKIIATSGTFGCPMTGNKNEPHRSELKIQSASKHTYTAYGRGPDGKEFKSMEIIYTKAK